MNQTDLLDLIAEDLGSSRLTLNAEGACTVWLDHEVDLDIQVLEPCDEVRFALPLGRPVAAHRGPVMAEALAANALLATTSPHHLAWEAATERLVLCTTLRLDHVARATLAGDLDTFIHTSSALRAQLQQAGVVSPESTESLRNGRRHAGFFQP